MTNKLTDAEIKKALECASCIDVVRNDALDLINRLQAENEKLQTVKKHIDTLIHRGVEYPTTETYEQAFKKALEQLYDNTNAEEKLQQILPMLDELKEDIKHDINLAKAEAYKEFAYELKQIPHIAVYKSEIDDLLKEKVGEDK